MKLTIGDAELLSDRIWAAVNAQDEAVQTAMRQAIKEGDAVQIAELDHGRLLVTLGGIPLLDLAVEELRRTAFD